MVQVGLHKQLMFKVETLGKLVETLRLDHSLLSGEEVELEAPQHQALAVVECCREIPGAWQIQVGELEPLEILRLPHLEQCLEEQVVPLALE